MKSNKWLTYTLGVLLTLVVLAAVGGVGFRMGVTQSASFANLTDGQSARASFFAHGMDGDFSRMDRGDLSRSFNLRKQMTADIAHELRTPLSLIIGHAEGVHDGVLEPSRENFEIIREEAERLEKLVNDLRTLSLADAGELSVDFQPVNINNLMSDAYTHYISLFNQHRITLNLKPAPVMLTANLDPSRFAQVLNNILDNALRYTPEGGSVDMETQQVENKAQLSIQDNGEGVTAEEAAHLFDRFYRADESRTRDDGGSGLGLAIAKSIIEIHSGRIWAESEKGRGLKVVIELPTYKD
jgi:signal transduction histidine kinase